MLDLSRDYDDLREQVLAAIGGVCDSQQFVLGPEVERFENEAAAFLGAEHVIACASGTDALWLALAAVGLGPGDVVITTPFSFFATASAIVRSGARPQFADVEPETLNLDPNTVERALQSAARVRALLPVHLYGQCVDADAFRQLANRHDLKLIEDAAQSFGAEWDGKSSGTLGDAAAFSFYPTKNLSAFGDAGCVATNERKIAERVRSLRNHGSRERYYHEEIGANSRLDGIQAAVLRVKLRYLESRNTARRELAQKYDHLLDSSGLTRGEDAPVRLLAVRQQSQHIFHQYVIRAHYRDELRAYLADRGIGSAVYYPVPLHLQRCFAYLGYSEGDFPVAERAAREVLALPIFFGLKTEEQQCVVDAIGNFYCQH